MFMITESDIIMCFISPVGEGRSGYGGSLQRTCYIPCPASQMLRLHTVQRKYIRQVAALDIVSHL